MNRSFSGFLMFIARGLSLVIGMTGLGSGLAWAADATVPPPYLVTGSNHVIVGVAWEEEAVRKVLPAWLTPAPGMTGAINIYQADGGYGLTPFQSAYFWVDVEGFDSASGIKGRWMLEGVYGPEGRTTVAMRDFQGFPVRNGSSRAETTADGKRAIGTMNGHDFVSVEIKPVPGSCKPGAVTLNYLSRKGLVQVPAAGDVCEAQPLSVKINAPPGDAFGAFRPAKLLWAIEFKNGAWANTAPQPLEKSDR